MVLCRQFTFSNVVIEAVMSVALPIELITHINFKDKYKAFEFERYLKSGSGKAFMNKRLI